MLRINLISLVFSVLIPLVSLGGNSDTALAQHDCLEQRYGYKFSDSRRFLMKVSTHFLKVDYCKADLDIPMNRVYDYASPFWIGDAVNNFLREKSGCKLKTWGSKKFEFYHNLSTEEKNDMNVWRLSIQMEIKIKKLIELQCNESVMAERVDRGEISEYLKSTPIKIITN